jgi:hypothetical protein
LGAGAFGRVLPAELTLLQDSNQIVKEVAVKQLYATAKDEGIREFLNEAKILFMTVHCNVVKV